MEDGALEPEPVKGEIDPQQAQAAFELLRRAAYRPGKASGEGGKPGTLGKPESSGGSKGKGEGGQGGGGKGDSAFRGKCWKGQG
eukprot:15459364-Alexandrium_andersonii.AAC.1